MSENNLEFRGGKFASFIPFLFFLAGCMVASVLGYACFESFWIAAAIGVVLSILLAKDPQECFQAIMKGTGNGSDFRCNILLGFQRYFCGDHGSVKVGQRFGMDRGKDRASGRIFYFSGIYSDLFICHVYRDRGGQYSDDVFHAVSGGDCFGSESLCTSRCDYQRQLFWR